MNNVAKILLFIKNTLFDGNTGLSVKKKTGKVLFKGTVKDNES